MNSLEIHHADSHKIYLFFNHFALLSAHPLQEKDSPVVWSLMNLSTHGLIQYGGFPVSSITAMGTNGIVNINDFRIVLLTFSCCYEKHPTEAIQVQTVILV